MIRYTYRQVTRVKWCLMGLFLVLQTTHGFGQENRIRDFNNVGWYTYVGNHKLTDRWSLHTEYQWRRIDFIQSWQQSLARAGLVYKLSDRVKVSSAYTLLVTYPYGNYPDASVPTPEHRIYEEITLSDQIGGLKLEHRFRLEQRWFGQPADSNPRDIADWQYENRARYQVSATYPLQGTTIDNSEFYLNAFEEIFVSFGRNVNSSIFDQNRLSGGVGYQISDNFKVELNYLSRILQHPKPDPVTNKAIFDQDRGFRLNVSYDIDFRAQK